ncbi:DUF1847 domain-containing protein [Puteibacter caeruleilacunae]|nr:DUF1847 domain-containing protein [Puteibacter caeruleilacunae]
MHTLYDEKDLKLMHSAEEVAGNKNNRIEMIKNFASKAGYEKIGIAHCIACTREAEILKEYLSDSFEVVAIDCKLGKYRKDEFLGINKKGIICNPAGQADYLASHGTELNLEVGLCVGHDIIFQTKSSAPVSTLFVKDFKTHHDTHVAFDEIKQQLACVEA